MNTSHSQTVSADLLQCTYHRSGQISTKSALNWIEQSLTPHPTQYRSFWGRSSHRVGKFLPRAV